MCVWILKYPWFNSHRSFEIRASSSCENVPQHIRFCSPSPPCPTRQCVSVCTSSGIGFSATFLRSFYGSHKCTDKNQSYFLLSPLCMFSLGSRQGKISSRHSAVTVCPLLYPFATCSLLQHSSRFEVLIVSIGRIKKKGENEFYGKRIVL